MVFCIVFMSFVYASGGHHHERYQKSKKQCHLPDNISIKSSEQCAEAWKEASGKESEATLKIASFSVEKTTCGFNHLEEVLYFAPKSTTNADEHEHLWDYVCDFGEDALEFSPNNALFVILLSIFVASIAHMIEHLFPDQLQPPHTVVLFVLGMSLSAAAFVIAKSEPDHLFVRMMDSFFDEHMFHIFMVFLPPLLFEDASCSNWHVFYRLIPNCLLVAVPGVLINTLCTAGCIFKFFSNTGDGVNDLSILSCALLGSILSATDPVAVIGTLNSLHAPDKLSTFIAGEALLNDGTAIVMFLIFFDAARGATEFNLFDAFMSFVRLGVGGVIFGLLWSLALHAALKMAHHMFMVQVLSIFFVVYVSFNSSELSFIHVSAVLVVVTVGYYMSAVGKHLIDIDHHHDLHSIISFLACICNESIFVLAGIIGWKLLAQDAALHTFVPLEDFTHWAELGLLYLIIHVSRGLAVLLLWPLLMRSGYGLQPKEAAIVVFGGLRGAVGLSLGLLVSLKEVEPSLPAAVRSRIAFHVSGITLLTLAFNGSVIGRVYKGLKIYAHAEYKEALFTRALLASELDVDIRVHQDLKRNWFFHNSFVDIAEHAIPHLRSRKERMHIGPLIGKIIRRANKNQATLAQRFAKKLKIQRSSAHQGILERSTASGKLKGSGGLKKIMHDDESAAEIYQTILNAAQARLEKMFKRQACDLPTYKILLSCFDHGEEAISGELRHYGYLNHPDTDNALRNLDKKPHKEQLGYAVHIVWAAALDQLRSPPSFLSVVAGLLHLDAPMGKWHRAKRDLEVGITFVFIFEQLLLELPVFMDFPKVLARVRTLVTGVRSDFLARVERNNRAYFIIAEHILCMKYIILLKQEVLEEYVERGVIQQADYSSVNSLFLIPAMEKLDNFVPTRNQVAGIKKRSRDPKDRTIERRRTSSSDALTPMKAISDLQKSQPTSDLLRRTKTMDRGKVFTASVSGPLRIKQISTRTSGGLCRKSSDQLTASTQSSASISLEGSVLASRGSTSRLPTNRSQCRRRGNSATMSRTNVERPQRRSNDT